jgi:hypothetical protein
VPSRLPDKFGKPKASPGERLGPSAGDNSTNLHHGAGEEVPQPQPGLLHSVGKALLEPRRQQGDDHLAVNGEIGRAMQQERPCEELSVPGGEK